MKYQISVNNTHSIEWDTLLNDTLMMHPSGPNTWNVLFRNKKYQFQLLAHDVQKKQMQLKVNGRIHQVTLEDSYDLLVKKMGFSNVAVHKVNEIKAPMPGLVVKILVEIGDEVEAGTPLLVLEAMKMENILKSTGPGKVKSILVQPSDAVQKSQILIQLE